MSILDIFRSNTNAVQQPQQPDPNAQVVPGNTTPPTNPADPGQGVVPANAAQPPGEPATPESPLDNFKDLWEANPVDPNAPAPKESQPLTAEQVQKAVSNSNFAAGISQEQLQAISAGGEEAQKAFSDALDTVAKQVMVQATMVNNKLTEKAVAEALEKQSAEIPQMLRKEQSTAHLNDTSELFSAPATSNTTVKEEEEESNGNYNP